jgi:hypothetical protein
MMTGKDVPQSNCNRNQLEAVSNYFQEKSEKNAVCLQRSDDCSTRNSWQERNVRRTCTVFKARLYGENPARMQVQQYNQYTHRHTNTTIT